MFVYLTLLNQTFKKVKAVKTKVRGEGLTLMPISLLDGQRFQGDGTHRAELGACCLWRL